MTSPKEGKKCQTCGKPEDNEVHYIHGNGAHMFIEPPQESQKCPKCGEPVYEKRGRLFCSESPDVCGWSRKIAPPQESPAPAEGPYKKEERQNDLGKGRHQIIVGPGMKAINTVSLMADLVHWFNVCYAAGLAAKPAEGDAKLRELEKVIQYRIGVPYGIVGTIIGTVDYQKETLVRVLTEIDKLLASSPETATEPAEKEWSMFKPEDVVGEFGCFIDDSIHKVYFEHLSPEFQAWVRKAEAALTAASQTAGVEKLKELKRLIEARYDEKGESSSKVLAFVRDFIDESLALSPTVEPGEKDGK